MRSNKASSIYWSGNWLGCSCRSNRRFRSNDYEGKENGLACKNCCRFIGELWFRARDQRDSHHCCKHSFVRRTHLRAVRPRQRHYALERNSIRVRFCQANKRRARHDGLILPLRWHRQHRSRCRHQHHHVGLNRVMESQHWTLGSCNLDWSSCSDHRRSQDNAGWCGLSFRSSCHHPLLSL